MATAPKTIGRGGAGNFRAPTTDAEQRAKETPDTPDTRTVNPQVSSVRSGRGGAGNINPSSSTPSSSSTSTSTSGPSARPDAVILSEAPKSAAKEVVYGGRGGAGNWK
ncbi:hypothetical protein VF21_10346, partial [Pseudogymnoascus sp. 05NY08]